MIREPGDGGSLRAITPASLGPQAGAGRIFAVGKLWIEAWTTFLTDSAGSVRFDLPLYQSRTAIFGAMGVARQHPRILPPCRISPAGPSAQTSTRRRAGMIGGAAVVDLAILDPGRFFRSAGRAGPGLESRQTFHYRSRPDTLRRRNTGTLRLGRGVLGRRNHDSVGFLCISRPWRKVNAGASEMTP